MASELLKKIAAGEEFDVVEAIREVAKVLAAADGVAADGVEPKAAAKKK